MLSVANKHFMLSVVKLNVVAAIFASNPINFFITAIFFPSKTG
jgi:hypothetical protein